jgi:hypothetical protein
MLLVKCGFKSLEPKFRRMKSFAEAKAEAERLNGKPFLKEGYFLHDHHRPD